MLILISHRGSSRTPKATKMEIFVSTINDSQPLNVVTKNFVLDVTYVLDPHDTLQIRLSTDLNQPEPVFSSRCFTLPASPVQSSKIILEQCFVKIQKKKNVHEIFLSS